MPPDRPPALPHGSRVVSTSDGFAVVFETETVAAVSWSDVQAIYAYSRFLAGKGALCLDFVLPPERAGDEEARVVVDDGIDGWETLTVEMTRTFPGLDRAWREKASASEDVAEVAASQTGPSLAPFTVNITEVWLR